MSRVFVRLCGGLGNQLFQYAAARALSLKIGAETFLDIRDYQPKRYRGGGAPKKRAKRPAQKVQGATALFSGITCLATLIIPQELRAILNYLRISQEEFLTSYGAILVETHGGSVSEIYKRSRFYYPCDIIVFT